MRAYLLPQVALHNTTIARRKVLLFECFNDYTGVVDTYLLTNPTTFADPVIDPCHIKSCYIRLYKKRDFRPAFHQNMRQCAEGKSLF